MTARLLLRLILPALGLLFTTGFVVQSETFEKRLPAWATSTRPKAQSFAEGQTGSGKDREMPRVIAEGRVVAYPGAEVVVGTEAAGRIVRLEVWEKSVVRKGDLIAELNAEDLKADDAQAGARVAEADADIRFFDRELHRDESLVTRRAGTLQNLDVNRRGLDAARARRAAALAERDRITALLDKTRITAPIDGVVTERHANAGETVEVAAKIVTIADLNRIRIEAEVDEFDTSHVTLGAEVLISAEGFPGAIWKGEVKEIPDAVVARRNRPEDPGRPIDSRILPVKIMFREPTPLKLGQRIEVEVLAGESHVSRRQSSHSTP